jgi:hypothetical protein
METLSSTSGFASEASLPGNAPHTPPYTPHRAKRPLERNDSPASVRSIHPAETSSPAKKAAKKQVKDDVKVEELTEGDAGYITDIDVVYPHELEEIETDSDHSSDGGDEEHEFSDDIASRLSRLGCDDSPEGQFERKRRAEHLRRRRDSRVFKRSHSQSVKSDTEVTDPEAMADHDVAASARRLRRRVRSPTGFDSGMDDVTSSPTQPVGLASSPEIRGRPGTADDTASSGRDYDEHDAMDVDVDDPK